MNTDNMPKPPAGTRWREVDYIGLDGHERVARCIDGQWQSIARTISGEWTPPVTAFSYLCVRDEDVEKVWSLRTNPTEPLPPPAVDRQSVVWEVAHNAMLCAMDYGGLTTKWCGGSNETDALLLALAPHWRELAALAGETAETPPRGIEITDAHIDAGIRAYSETSAYWAPEVMHSPGHVRKLVERILAVVEDAV